MDKKDDRRSLFRSYLRSSLPDGVTDLANARQIPVALLSPNPFQPRTTFKPDGLDEMAASIHEHGVLQPLLARPHPDDPDTYQIGAGERRWRAAQRAGLDTVPCIVRDLDDRQMREIGLIENVQREDLTPADLARSLQDTMIAFGLSARALSERLGKNHSYVDDKLKIVRDPRLAAAVESGAIGPTVAVELAGLSDEDARAALLARADQGQRIKVKDVHAAGRPVPVKPATDETLRIPSAAEGDTNGARPLPVKPAGDLPASAPSASAGPSATIVPVKPAGELLATDPGQVHLRDLRIIQLREGRDGEPRQLDVADPAVVLRILEADLAWLKDTIRRAAGHPLEG